VTYRASVGSSGTGARQESARGAASFVRHQAAHQRLMGVGDRQVLVDLVDHGQACSGALGSYEAGRDVTAGRQLEGSFALRHTGP